ncbi:MAG: hypothetical protein GY811_13730 [Myxococcales bacterium]|nr:hypothetical protein [Myxococcales bacterium]
MTEAARAKTKAARAGEFVEEADQLSERVRDLEIRVKQHARLLYGRKSEKLSPENLAQLALAFGDDEEGGDEPDVPTPPSPDEQDSPPAPSAGESGKGKKKRPNHPGRSPLSPDLERIVVATALVPASERSCECCGESMQTIDYEELLEIAAPSMDASTEGAIAFGGCVRSMIATLPAGYRKALELVEVEGMSQAQAAEVLGLSLWRQDASAAGPKPSQIPSLALLPS